MIPIEKIDRPNPPVRLAFDEEEIKALTESILAQGILVPLLVRRVGDRFEVIDGDSRLEAAGRARLGQIPAVVRNATDSETHVLRLLANLDRSNPDVVSEAVYIAKALQTGAIDIESFAMKLHRTERWIEDRLTIAEMPEYMQEALRKREISLGVALELYQIDAEAWRLRYVEMAKNDGMTVLQAKACREQYQSTKQRFEESGTLPEEPVGPIVIPRIEARCAKCGVVDDVGALTMVRIHFSECSAS
jgi:ParB family chromosome partitioning protein